MGVFFKKQKQKKNGAIVQLVELFDVKRPQLAPHRHLCPAVEAKLRLGGKRSDSIDVIAGGGGPGRTPSEQIQDPAKRTCPSVGGPFSPDSPDLFYRSIRFRPQLLDAKRSQVYSAGRGGAGGHREAPETAAFFRLEVASLKKIGRQIASTSTSLHSCR